MPFSRHVIINCKSLCEKASAMEYVSKKFEFVSPPVKNLDALNDRLYEIKKSNVYLLNHKNPSEYAKKMIEVLENFSLKSGKIKVYRLF